MAKAQSNQTAETAPEAVSEPVVQEEKKEPVIETEDLSEDEGSKEEVVNIFGSNGKSLWSSEGIKQEKESTPERPENDRKLSHEKRILAFLEARHTGDFIKLNDFLKSLYPLPKPNEKPAWKGQGVMRKLRQDLMAMRDRGEIVFSNNNPERLGDNYHVGEQRVRQDYNIGDLVIEAKLA